MHVGQAAPPHVAQRHRPAVDPARTLLAGLHIPLSAQHHPAAARRRAATRRRSRGGKLQAVSAGPGRPSQTLRRSLGRDSRVACVALSAGSRTAAYDDLRETHG